MHQIVPQIRFSFILPLVAMLCICPPNANSNEQVPRTKPKSFEDSAYETPRTDLSGNPIPRPNPRKSRSSSTPVESAGNGITNFLNNERNRNESGTGESKPANADRSGAIDSSPSTETFQKVGIDVLDSTGSVNTLADGISALQSGQISKFFELRNSLPQSIDRRILDWRYIFSEPEELTSEFVINFIKEAPHWPSERIMQRRLESALWREEPESDRIYSIFSRKPPQTDKGKLLYALALKDLGFKSEAESIIRHTWRTLRLTSSMEAMVLDEFGSQLTTSDHLHRVDMFLFDDRIKDATRTAQLLTSSQKTYFKAFSAMIRKRNDATTLLRNVHSSMHSHPGHIFAQIRHLRRNEKFKAAAKLMLNAPQSPEVLVDRDEWWLERRLLASDMLDIGDPQTAYNLVAGHSAESSAKYVEAEFFSGWYALRQNSRPGKAESHFRNILKAATIPASISRGYYWLGRTEEHRGRTEKAVSYFRKASEYGMAYYGQLAREKLGLQSVGLTPPPVPNSTDQLEFEANDQVRAIERMYEAKLDHLVGSLYDTLAKNLPTTGQLALLTNLAEKNGHNQFVVYVGKTAIKRAKQTALLSFPVPNELKKAKIRNGVERSLVFAIARQESSFNQVAKSSAGALGLLQLLPSTAKETARKIGASYSKSRLTKDPSYNVLIGSAFLGELVERFNGSYILTFAGYNAGPRRARQWIEKYGDPRTPEVDPIDWIERIPFTETRNYVQKVTENLQVYRGLLDGRNLAIEADLNRGT